MVLVGAEAADEMQAMTLQLAQKRAELCSMFSTHLEAWSDGAMVHVSKSRHSAMNNESYLFVYPGSCASIADRQNLSAPSKDQKGEHAGDTTLLERKETAQVCRQSTDWLLKHKHLHRSVKYTVNLNGVA